MNPASALTWFRRTVHLFPTSHYVLLSALFFIGLELISAFHRLIIPLFAVLLLLIAYGIVLIRLEDRERFQPLQALLPLLTAAGLAGFTLFLPLEPTSPHLYFILAALLLYWLLKHGAKQAYPTWNWGLSTVVLFLNIAVILGIRTHIYLPVLITLILMFSVVFLVSLQALFRASRAFMIALLQALIVALVLTELTWTLQFLPIDYVIQAGTIVVAYYVLFNLLSISFERQLQRRDFIEYAGVGSVALMLLLLTARWI